MHLEQISVKKIYAEMSLEHFPLSVLVSNMSVSFSLNTSTSYLYLNITLEIFNHGFYLY